MDSSTAERSSLSDSSNNVVGELSKQFAEQKRAKSPPLAFQPTSNDALALPIFNDTNTDPPSQRKAGSMGPHPWSTSSQGDETRELQAVIEQQSVVINKLHEAFAAERKMWDLDKARLVGRIASLETLLSARGGHSPAQSPILSPHNGGSNVTSPQTRASVSSHRLPSIAEDENIQPLSARREGAPHAIDIPAITNYSFARRTSVNFAEATPTSVKVEEIPVSPAVAGRTLSPPPFNYRMEAGHTPLKALRPPTPPPQNSMSMDGIEDTPTRNNTHANTWLTRSRDEDTEKELKGPLNMPELPNAPAEGNFTFDMLSKRLEQIEQHPEDVEVARPQVFKERSPGLASPANEYEFSPKTVADTQSETPAAPPATRAFPPQDMSASDVPSNALSPNNMASLSKQTSRDDHVQQDFENGGIKLKKQPSTNFGAPFGQLSGFPRKLS